jgi:hypothetical protein
MAKHSSFLFKLIAAAVVFGLGTAYSAKADSYSFSSTVYYAGPTTDPSAPPDNPFGVTNPVIGNAISGLALTSAGGQGTLTFNTNGNPGVSITSATPGLFTVNLYGAAASSIVTGTTLNAGTYNFSDANDYFGIATAGGSTGFGCTAGQACNTGTSPVDVTTITVGPSGLITVSSSSLELVADPAPPAGVPEIDPKNAMVPFALLAGVVLLVRGRRPKSAVVELESYC